MRQHFATIWQHHGAVAVAAVTVAAVAGRLKKLVTTVRGVMVILASLGMLALTQLAVTSLVAQAAAQLPFHERLAAAAIERTKSIVIYNPQYFKIPYPGGDVPDHFGVCTDVVIRAYRSLGLDLQKEVHQKMGGDRNIAHRRVRVLRKFFARYGQSLTITKDPNDYKPGDIVTYYIPEAIFSKDHIAIVTDKTGTSGAPMIVHNIGLGPKLDDDLFSWKITGHYRYGG